MDWFQGTPAYTEGEQSSRYPFPTLDEWKLAENLMRSGLSHAKIDRLLALPTMVTHANASFYNSRSLLQLIDAIPPVGPEFKRTSKSVGTYLMLIGSLSLRSWNYSTNPVKCVPELVGNTASHDMRNSEHNYNDMWTANWWWNLQSKLPPGATIAPIILASDKTQLSQFSGDKSSWLVYLTIRNISKCTCRQIGKHAMILLGYIPVSKLHCFATANQRKMQAQHLFHYCLQTMLQPLFAVGAQGVDVFPILAACIADFPEQALVACTLESWCPICSCFPEDHFRHPPCSTFWHGLPHCDIFCSLTPDILHQLHIGVFKDHLSTWCTSLATNLEIDACFKVLPIHLSVKSFKKGISTVSQWTGTDHALLDFIYLSQYPSHSTMALQQLQDALEHFHNHKQFFIDHQVRQHFHIPKFHMMEHYVESIKS
ncbi:hypothetical protein JB92DRAFT_3207991 [Gautieria morchelliformis]|nr:hypothetical protein JB92DRAFT_3207991 [Gautieria morchelliformis]